MPQSDISLRRISHQICNLHTDTFLKLIFYNMVFLTHETFPRSTTLNKLVLR